MPISYKQTTFNYFKIRQKQTRNYVVYLFTFLSYSTIETYLHFYVIVMFQRIKLGFLGYRLPYFTIKNIFSLYSH